MNIVCLGTDTPLAPHEQRDTGGSWRPLSPKYPRMLLTPKIDQFHNAQGQNFANHRRSILFNETKASNA